MPAQLVEYLAFTLKKISLFGKDFIIKKQKIVSCIKSLFKVTAEQNDTVNTR